LVWTELGVLLEQTIIDLEAKISWVLELLHVYLQFLYEFWKVGLNCHWQWFLYHIVTILIK
jgi:hypothetical protein